MEAIRIRHSGGQSPTRIARNAVEPAVQKAVIAIGSLGEAPKTWGSLSKRLEFRQTRRRSTIQTGLQRKLMSKHPKPESSLLPGILKNRAFRIQGHNLTPKILVLPRRASCSCAFRGSMKKLGVSCSPKWSKNALSF